MKNASLLSEKPIVLSSYLAFVQNVFHTLLQQNEKPRMHRHFYSFQRHFRIFFHLDYIMLNCIFPESNKNVRLRISLYLL